MQYLCIIIMFFLDPLDLRTKHWNPILSFPVYGGQKYIREPQAFGTCPIERFFSVAPFSLLLEVLIFITPPPPIFQGLALTDVTSVPPSISYFPAAELPQDPAPRFLKLFQVRAKWTLDEIEPYVRWVWLTGDWVKVVGVLCAFTVRTLLFIAVMTLYQLYHPTVACIVLLQWN